MTTDICPNCGSNFDCGLVFDHFLGIGHGLQGALEKAELYGATSTAGWFDRKIAIYDRDRDRTVAYRCPDCGHQWDRK